MGVCQHAWYLSAEDEREFHQWCAEQKSSEAPFAAGGRGRFPEDGQEVHGVRRGVYRGRRVLRPRTAADPAWSLKMGFPVK
jgi:hypothetical protein